MKRNSGYIYAIAAAVLFGASTPFSKIILENHSPWMVAGVLYFGSGVGLSMLYLAKALFWPSSAEAKLSRKDIPGMAGATFFGGVLGPVFLMYGLSKTTAASASLFLNLEAVCTALIAWFVFKEAYDRRILCGMAFIVLGGVALTYSPEFIVKNLFGPALIALACLSWGIDNNFTRKVSASDPVQISMVKSLIAGGTNLVLSSFAHARLPNLKIVLEGSFIGFAGYGLSLTFFVLGLRHIGTSRTGAYFSMAPFVGAAISLLFFHDSMTVQIGIAAILMAAGVYLHLTEKHSHEHEHEELAHNHRHVHDEHHQHNHDPDDPIGEPHAHFHQHVWLRHSHPHFPDIHHRHSHDSQ